MVEYVNPNCTLELTCSCENEALKMLVSLNSMIN